MTTDESGIKWNTFSDTLLETGNHAIVQMFLEERIMRHQADRCTNPSNLQHSRAFVDGYVERGKDKLEENLLRVEPLIIPDFLLYQ